MGPASFGAVVFAFAGTALGRDLVRGTFEVGKEAPSSTRRVVPDGCVDLLFNLGERRGIMPDGRLEPVAAAVGVVTRAREIVRPAAAPLFGVAVSPHVARALLGVPLRDLTDRIVDLADVLGPNANDLTDRLREAPDLAARTRLFVSHLARRLSSGPSPNPDVARITEEIHRHGGRLTMRALSERVAIPERRLERLFSEHVGVSPKQVSRVARVQRALSALDGDGATLPWGQFAQHLGFADQAHLIREFKVLTGETPARYPRARALSDSFNTARGPDLT